MPRHTTASATAGNGMADKAVILAVRRVVIVPALERHIPFPRSSVETINKRLYPALPELRDTTHYQHWPTVTPDC